MWLGVSSFITESHTSAFWVIGYHRLTTQYLENSFFSSMTLLLESIKNAGSQCLIWIVSCALGSWCVCWLPGGCCELLDVKDWEVCCELVMVRSGWGVVSWSRLELEEVPVSWWGLKMKGGCSKLVKIRRGGGCSELVRVGGGGFAADGLLESRCSLSVYCAVALSQLLLSEALLVF